MIWRRAWDAELTGIRELQETLVHFERMGIGATVPLLLSAGRILEGVEDPLVKTSGLLSIALGHTLRVNVEAAEPFVRRELAMAEHLDDNELVNRLPGMLAASAQMRERPRFVVTHC